MSQPLTWCHLARIRTSARRAIPIPPVVHLFFPRAKRVIVSGHLDVGEVIGRCRRNDPIEPPLHISLWVIRRLRSSPAHYVTHREASTNFWHLHVRMYYVLCAHTRANNAHMDARTLVRCLLFQFHTSNGKERRFFFVCRVCVWTSPAVCTKEWQGVYRSFPQRHFFSHSGSSRDVLTNFMGLRVYCSWRNFGERSRPLL